MRLFYFGILFYKGTFTIPYSVPGGGELGNNINIYPNLVGHSINLNIVATFLTSCDLRRKSPQCL